MENMRDLRALIKKAGLSSEEMLIIDKVDFQQYPFKAISDDGKTIVAETVIIATGATARWLGLESEKRYNGHGVSACATCDGFFFKGKERAVKIWDESLLLGRKLTLDRTEIGGLLTTLNKENLNLYEQIENIFIELKQCKDGDVYPIPSFDIEMVQ